MRALSPEQVRQYALIYLRGRFPAMVNDHEDIAAECAARALPQPQTVTRQWACRVAHNLAVDLRRHAETQAIYTERAYHAWADDHTPSDPLRDLIRAESESAARQQLDRIGTAWPRLGYLIGEWRNDPDEPMERAIARLPHNRNTVKTSLHRMRHA